MVLVRKAMNLIIGYSFVRIDYDRGSVWDAFKSTMETQSLSLALHSETSITSL